MENNATIWAKELDALIAAPQHHKLLFENEWVRVLDTNIPAGEITNVHTHQHPASLYIISWSDFIRYDAEGNILLDSRTLATKPLSGSAIWGNALTAHTLKNIGNTNLHVICVEIKNTN
ncbi:MAG: hypothetical protein JST29_05190 [Bacteroidetes bacterium]|nr:hypothetical protein [Bacteroidota bacterium]MBS1591143.1 hypothetical protein [Bacteroidota bacterium]